MRSLFSFLILFSSMAYGQQSEYRTLTKKADSLYFKKEYKQGAEALSRAMALPGKRDNALAHYNASCLWALAGFKDSAISNLQVIAGSGYQKYAQLIADHDLTSLHSDARWDGICAEVKKNKEKAEAHLNKRLVAELDSIMDDDQKGRTQLKTTEEKYGSKSPEMKELWKGIDLKDSLDLVKVKRIIAQYGWPGPDIAGDKGSQAVFLVIQHSDMQTRKEYLPVMRKAVKEGKAHASSFALLEDRVALEEGRRQVYGSQIGRDSTGKYFVSPLEDPDNVDKRREEMGLGTMADYLQNWNTAWDVEAYKKKMADRDK